MKPRRPARLALWLLLLSLTADLLPPAASAGPGASPPREQGQPQASAGPAPADGSLVPRSGPLLLAQADEEGYRPRRRRRRRASGADTTQDQKKKETEPAAPPAEEAPKTASFPGEAVLAVRDEAWRITVGGGAVEIVIAKGTFPADRDTSLTVRPASVAGSPTATAGSGGSPPTSAGAPGSAVAVVSAVYEIGFTSRPAKPLLLRMRFDITAQALQPDPRLATLVHLSSAGDAASARPVGGRVDRIAGAVEAGITAPGLFAVAVRRPGFTDLRSHPAVGEASLLAARGLMAGFPDGTFRPDFPLTRAQLARLLATAARQEGRAPAAPPSPAFADVPATAWYAPDVATVKAMGLMLGQGDRFHPGAPVTRQELALVALRLAGIAPGPPPDVPPAAGPRTGSRNLTAAQPRPSPVADARLAAPWAAGGLVTAVEAGFLATDARRRARPRDPATRGEAAQALARALERRGFFEISTVVSGRLGKVHIPSAYYEIRTSDGRTYVLEPAAPDVDSSLRRTLGGSLTATGYVNPASPYKIRGTALRTVALAGVVLASDAPPVSAAPAQGRRRKTRPRITADEPIGNPLDDEDDGPRRRRRKRATATPPASVQGAVHQAQDQDGEDRPGFRRRRKKPAPRPPQARTQPQRPKAQPKAQPPQPKGGTR